MSWRSLPFYRRRDFKEWILWGIGVAICLLVLAIGRQAVRRYGIAEQARVLREQQQALATRNVELVTLLDYARTPSYTEEQARLRFGLSKPGERLAIIPETPPPSVDRGTSSTSFNQSDDSTALPSNYRRWWRYFFGSPSYD